MKTTVAITGWSSGLSKVSLTKLIQEHTGLSLTAAKRCTDEVLDGRAAALVLPTAELAVAFRDALLEIGAQAEAHDAA